MGKNVLGGINGLSDTCAVEKKKGERERDEEKGRKEVSIMKFVLRHLFTYVSTKVQN